MRHEKQLLAVIHGPTSRADHRTRWQQSITEAIVSAMGPGDESLAHHSVGLDPSLFWLMHESRAGRLDPTGFESTESSRFGFREDVDDAIAPPTATAWLARLLSWPASLWTSLAQARRARRDRHVLQGLDDRMLKDIGVSRSEIFYASRHGRRKP